jgi:hypothetical protein
VGEGGAGWTDIYYRMYLKPHFSAVDDSDQLSVVKGTGNRDIGVAFWEKAEGACRS